MRSEGWRGKGHQHIANWRIQARRAANVAKNKTYSMGGMPRAKKPAPVSLPRLAFLEPEAKR